MNRFFSKLDLRDIKIDPEGSRFPPDADELRTEDVAQETVDIQAAAVGSEVSTFPGAIAESRYEPGLWERPVTVPTVEAPAEIIQDPIVQSDVVLEEHSIAAFAAMGMEGVVVEPEGEVLKVSARSRPSAVAGAIAGVVREVGRAEVQAIGAGATNQAIKAVAIAREYLRETGIDAVCLPAFIDVTIDNEDRTAIRMVVEAR
jgi:stage V sporulation protein S